MVYLNKNKLITPGDFALVFMLNFEIVNWLFQAYICTNRIRVQLWHCEAALSILDYKEEVQDEENAPDLKVTEGRIVFHKVEFRYENSELLFKDKSLVINKGHKVGLVGHSGGGKSNFVSLILRLHVIQGEVLIGDQNVKKVNQESLCSSIGMILQDTGLFNRSIMENIRYGKRETTDEEVIEAAKKAYAHDFITNFL